MPTSTHTENSSRRAESQQDAFATAWAEWHDAHERHRADPHGFLAVTHLHWLGAEPARLDGVPGTWRVEDDAVRLVLGPGESLQRDGRELNPEGGATVELGPIAERDGINLTAGDTVVELAKRGGEYIVRPRHPGNPLLMEYRGTPAYAPDGTVSLDFNWAVNPPCAYTDLATCPLPPAENRLPVPVEAGEKTPTDRQDA
ncbi:DUF1684 domain-containing protein [Arthrobacter sp. ISL-69]|uniref:DUF1684 domain-containing protein n=1 Tax=Arthrobacter sp. ISL-69 TaxID=2819113 RepID=UPI001BE5FA83|nr:DUF1684 domain-containing protein [Arthrobacter sp. ISL-69]MBT2535109.1 DUF1684 domain-containing protein [Arthrobacter sp. ISL-69]